jgi:hypothetical protein
MKAVNMTAQHSPDSHSAGWPQAMRATRRARATAAG